MKRVILGKKFYERDVLLVAEELLGKFLVHRDGTSEISFMITEVEAYDGEDDKACHAHKGKTSRTGVMFGQAGVWYVYLIYGMYNMLNIVTGPKDYPAAILIRGTKEVSGPGKLTKAMKVDRGMTGKAEKKKTGLWIEDRGIKIYKKNIQRTSRIGVEYAGPIWAKKPYRFILQK